MRKSESSTERYSVSPELYEMMQDVVYWFDNPEDLPDQIWILFMLATSPDKLSDRLHINQINDLAFIVVIIKELLANIAIEITEND